MQLKQPGPKELQQEPLVPINVLLASADVAGNTTAPTKTGKLVPTVTLVKATVDAEVNPDIRGGLAAENAEEMRALLGGGGRPGHRDAVILNAAGALVVAGRAANVPEAWPMAADALDSGAAKAALAKLVDVSRSAP